MNRQRSPRTAKDDWLADLLAHRGYVVSGHSTFGRRLGAPEGVVPVLRHARLYGSAFPEVVLLTLEYPGDSGIPDLEEIAASPLCRQLVRLFRGLQILTYARESPDSFTMPDRGALSSSDLLEWFAAVDARFVAQSGTAKPVNRSVNDPFVTWTRHWLTRHCVVNDIDALMPPTAAAPGVLLELKRPRTDLRRWGPYRADRRNYESCSLIAERLRLEKRTIAYNAGRRDRVRLHLDVRTEQGRLVSQTAMTTPEAAVAVPLSDELVLSWHVSSR